MPETPDLTISEFGDAASNKLVELAASELRRLVAAPLAAGLYLVSTPIGNLSDITLRALSVLARADVIYCEDTRHSARLLQRYGITTRTRPFHEHNEDLSIDRALADLEAGRRIAVISDAGTPLLSDPGFKLVRAAAAANLAVHAIPGPSAALAALTAGGLPTDAFFFAGFLPAKQGARRARLAELASVPGTLIFFESPNRVAEALADMADVLGQRSAVMARELTKMHEDIARGSLQELADATRQQVLKGEVVLLVGIGDAIAVSDEQIALELEHRLRSMSLKDASKTLADELGVAKARVYAIGLKSKDRSV